MQRTNRVAAFTAVLAGLVTALTITAPAQAAPNCTGSNPPPICDQNPEGPDDPPAGHAPDVAIDGVQQSTDRTTVHVWGWTVDIDKPRASLSVSFTLDGTRVGAMIANQPRPDVAAAFPKYGAAHGFDMTIPISPIGHNICVNAAGVGGGSDRNVCRQMDDIAQFEANDISYDTSRAVLTNEALEQLDKVTNVNDTTVQQSTEVSGNKTVTDVKGWTTTEQKNLNVSTTIKTGIPIFAEGKVNVSQTGQTTYAHNASTTTAQQFSWRQPVIVPARSRIEATVAITHFTISVPYTLLGNYVYRSGLRVPGTIGGVFTGANSTNLVVHLQQFNLDGSRPAAPVRQPAASMLKASPTR